MKLKMIKPSLATVAILATLSLPALAVVPAVQIQCNSASKNQHQLQMQLEEGYVYNSLQIKTKSASKATQLDAEQLQNSVVQMTFNAPVKSVTLTYQDHETQSSVVLAEEVQCVAPVALNTPVELTTQPTETFKIQMNDADALLADLATLTEKPVTSAPMTEPEQVVVPSGVEVQPSANETVIAEILPIQEPETSAEILGIETTLKPNIKHRIGAQNSKKKANAVTAEEDYDFSEDIEDF